MTNEGGLALTSDLGTAHVLGDGEMYTVTLSPSQWERGVGTTRRRDFSGQGPVRTRAHQNNLQTLAVCPQIK